MTQRHEKTDLLRGTLDLLILRTLELQPLHGVAIAERLRQVTHGTFVVQAWLALSGAPPARTGSVDQGALDDQRPATGG